jgi:hypothetical protein
MSLLVYSPNCPHSIDIIEYVKNNSQLKQLITFHNINTHGIPYNHKSSISRVPTMLTKNGKILVGKEIKNWLMSLLPNNDLSHHEFGAFGSNMSSIDGKDGDDDAFSLDSYGVSLQPAMTKELEERINRSVSEAYNDIKT